MINIPKGTKDVLPSESYKWHYVENLVKEVAKNFALREIRTPTFEHTELFLRGVGDTTDIVNKEMYSFKDKGERDITLKPEGTAGVARSFVENGLHNSAMPLKMYYITPVFRYERPQAGRLREHHQFGVEIYGASNPSVDAEVILIANTILNKLGLQVELNINSMGCKTCRENYNKALKEYIASCIDKMCPVCKERFNKNPLRILDCKEDGCKELTKNAPKITEFLCDDCNNHFNLLQDYLTISGVKYKINPYIVRGLDYYTRTVFEFVTTALGTQGTVCGGGRYDGLIEQIGGTVTQGVGFGMGLERVLMLMEAWGIKIEDNETVSLYVASMGDNASKKAFEIAYKLRREGISVEVDHLNRSFKAQFKYADKIKAKYVIAIGENELESGICTLKLMSTGESKQITFDQIKENLV